MVTRTTSTSEATESDGCKDQAFIDQLKVTILQPRTGTSCSGLVQVTVIARLRRQRGHEVLVCGAGETGHCRCVLSLRTDSAGTDVEDIKLLCRPCR